MKKHMDHLRSLFGSNRSLHIIRVHDLGQMRQQDISKYLKPHSLFKTKAVIVVHKSETKKDLQKNQENSSRTVA